MSFLDGTALELATAVCDGSQEVTALVDAQGRSQVVSAPEMLEQLLGYGPDELAGVAVAELFFPQDQQRVRMAFDDLLARPGARTSLEFRAKHRDGHFVWLRATAVNRCDDPAVGAVVVHASELFSDSDFLMDLGQDEAASSDTDQADFRQALQAAVDEKNTKFWNAARFARASVKDRRFDFCVVTVEVGNHKRLLGSYGHDVMDGMMREIIRRLHSLIKPGDALTQVTPSELALLFIGVGGFKEVQTCASRVQQAVEKHCYVGGAEIAATAIIGVATSQRQYPQAEDVMRDAAAAASRAATRQGGGHEVFETKMREQDVLELSLVAELHRALEEGQFELHYQPIISLADGVLRGFEALARWHHPRSGMVMPSHFIPLAEESGTIVSLGAWVLAEACDQAATWSTLHPMQPPLTISINMSAAELADGSLAQRIEEVLKRTGLDANQLTVEITESAVMDNSEGAASAVSLLQLFGVKLSLDDFGTGYSSFSYLHRLPYDTLKIDRSLVANIGSSGAGVHTRQVVAAIVGLAHNLQLDVVAEGVETEEQATALRQMGCDKAQGFLFGHPMPAREATSLLAGLTH
ncbi:MAG: EAL domain-containing protein [Deltaproteobacteria bacterium]|nr:EAL domain-containing protein [Deltaproteobacteria bacterium]